MAVVAVAPLRFRFVARNVEAPIASFLLLMQKSFPALPGVVTKLQRCDVSEFIG